MADPRLEVSWEGVGAVYATFKGDGSTVTYDATQDGGSDVVGRAVTLSADETVATAADAEAVLGKLRKVEADDIATVQVAGFMTLPAGTGAGLGLGKKIVGDLLVAAEGYIREVDEAVATELEVARGVIIDAGTTTAVWVLL